jgi:hypothetical protein
MRNLVERVAELESAINWACGCGDEPFERAENEPPYWWRAVLVSLAKMEFDGNKYVASRKEPKE